MIRRKNLRTRSIKMLILDEADEMLNKGLSYYIIRGLGSYDDISWLDKVIVSDPVRRSRIAPVRQS